MLLIAGIAFASLFSAGLTAMVVARWKDREWGRWLDAVNKSWNDSLP